ncbi:MAG: hypothetical protein WEB58_10070 [Planctomycetaceae bacterium]
MSRFETGPSNSGPSSGVQEDPVLVSSRREAIIVFVVFIIALFWSILASYDLGYLHHTDTGTYIGSHPENVELTYVFGFPHWVFWGIVIPWGSCIVFSIIFGAFLVRDEDLGEELEEQSDFI